ncbi:MAG: DNA repair protein RadC [Alphaproteobacteria bacterium]|nr:DNA repair protein RadC [Alphaproteobacteria bacterium]
MKTETKTNDKPLYLGHRARLRERFLKDNGASMPDYEFLELMLTYAIPRRDVKDDAKKLIARFGSLAKALTASDENLKEFGLTENTITLFKAILAANKRLGGARLKETHYAVYKEYDYVLDYCKAAVFDAKVEEFHVMMLDKKLHLIEDRLIQRGSVDEVPVYARDVARHILETHATAVVLYHNHPSGDCEPSQADIKCTKEIIEVLTPLKIKVCDHIIVSRDNYYSFHDHKVAGL